MKHTAPTSLHPHSPSTSEGSTGISALEQQAQFTYNFNEQELALIRNAAELYLNTKTKYRVATEALSAAYTKLPCVLPSNAPESGCIMSCKGLDLAWQRYCAYSSCRCIECVFRAYGEAVFQEIARQVKTKNL